MRECPSEALVCICVIFCYPVAEGIHQAETEICLGFVLVGGKAVPMLCLRFVARNGFTFTVHVAEIYLGFGITLFSGYAVPFDGFLIVLLHTFGFLLHDAKIVLSNRLALLGGTPVPFKRLGVP